MFLGITQKIDLKMVKRMRYISLYLNNDFFPQLLFSIMYQFMHAFDESLGTDVNQIIGRSFNWISYRFSESSRVETYTSQAAAFKRLKSELPVFQSRIGAMLFLISALLSRGLVWFSSLPTYLVYHLSSLGHHLSGIIKHLPSYFLLANFLNYIHLLAWNQLCLSNM